MHSRLTKNKVIELIMTSKLSIGAYFQQLGPIESICIHEQIKHWICSDVKVDNCFMSNVGLLDTER